MKKVIISFYSFINLNLTESSFTGYKKYEDDVIIRRKSVIEDIKDILIDLTDDGLYRVGFNDIYHNNQFLVIRTAITDKPIYLNNFKDYIIRLIDYLGDYFIGLLYSKHPSFRKGDKDINKTYINIELEDFLKDDFIIKEGLWSITVKYSIS